MESLTVIPCKLEMMKEVEVGLLASWRGCQEVKVRPRDTGFFRGANGHGNSRTV
jgi:hypothetical protein